MLDPKEEDAARANRQPEEEDAGEGLENALDPARRSYETQISHTHPTKPGLVDLFRSVGAL